MSSLPSPPPLLSVALVYASKPGLSELAHVISATSSYLDSCVEMEFCKACKYNSVELLERIWHSCSPESEPSPADLGTGHGTAFSRRKYLRTDKYYYRFQFLHGIAEAVKQPHCMAVVRWLFEHFHHCQVDNDVVQCAASEGNLEVLQFFLDEGIGVRCFDDGRVRRESPPDKNFVEWGHRDMDSAARNGREDIVSWLHHTVEAPRHMDGGLSWAVKLGSIEKLEWIEDNYGISSDSLIHFGRSAIEEGNLDVLEWMFSRGYLTEVHMHADDMVKKGNLILVKWLLEHNLVEAIRVLTAAASLGQLEIAQYVYDTYWPIIRDEQHYPLDPFIVSHFSYRGCPTLSVKPMVAAASRGHLNTVRWLFETFGNMPGITLFGVGPMPDENPSQLATEMDAAAMNGHLDVLQYFHEILVGAKGSLKRKRGTAERGRWPSCSFGAMDAAAANNHMDVVQWLHVNRSEGCTMNAIDSAAANGHLEMVKWLYQNRVETRKRNCMLDGAATNGHLDVVKWLDKIGAGCTTNAMDNAARNGHLDVVKWLHENRDEGCTTRAMDDAARYGMLHVVKWLHENRTEGCTAAAMGAPCTEDPDSPLIGTMAKVERADMFEVVQWLHKHCSAGCTSSAMDDAASSSQFDAVLFLHSMYREGCTQQAFEDIENDDVLLFKWFLKHYPAMAGY